MGKKNFLIIFLLVIVVISISMLALKSILLASIGLIVLVLLLTIFIYPYFGLILYIVLLYIRPQDFLPALAPFRIMLSLAILVLLFFLVKTIFNRDKIEVIPTAQNVLMFALLLVVPLSDISNFRITDAWDSLNTFLTLLLPFFLIVSITGDKYKLLYWCITFAGLFLAINGIIQHYNGVDLFGVTPMSGRIEWVGIFSDPNDFALLLVSSLPIILFYLFKDDKHLFMKIGLIAMLVVFFMAIYFTNSRGGYLAVIAVLASFAFKKWGLKKGIIFGSILIVIALLVAPSRMAEITPHGSSASGRVYAWMRGFELLKTHPVFGIGMHKFTDYYSKAAHSAFIKCVAELGLVGLFIWIGLIYTSFRDLIRIENSSADQTLILYSRITQVSIIGFLASAVFLSQTYNPIIYILFGISGTLYLNLQEELGIQFQKFKMNDFVIILFLEVGSILVYKVFMILY